MSFLRHGEIYRSDGVSKTILTWGPGAASRWSAPEPSLRTRRKERALLIVRDEFPVGYSLAGCSPAEPASASPTGSSMRWNPTAGNHPSANGNLSLVSVSQARGPLHFWNIPLVLVVYAVLAWLLLRYGIVPLIVAVLTADCLLNVPLTLDFSAWYIASSLAGMLLFLGIAAYGFRCTVAGKKLFELE